MARQKTDNIAEQKIAAASLSGATKLDLSDNKLTALPESLGRLTQLQSLYLSGNQLTTLPESLGRLTQLQSLDLSGNQLTALPESLARLHKLWNLNLFSNKLQSLPDWLGGFTLLESLAVGNNPLQFLPDSLSHCSEIKWLDLGDEAGGCPLGELPSFIRHLPKLKDLIAYKCGLTSLPVWLIELKNLTGLCLDRNPLEPDVAAAYKEGLDAVKRYLSEMAKGAKKRYEA